MTTRTKTLCWTAVTFLYLVIAGVTTQIVATPAFCSPLMEDSWRAGNVSIMTGLVWPVSLPFILGSSLIEGE